VTELGIARLSRPTLKSIDSFVIRVVFWSRNPRSDEVVEGSLKSLLRIMS